MQPVWGITISLLLCCCLWDSAVARSIANSMLVYNGGELLDWGSIHMCPTGYASGFSLKMEPIPSGELYGKPTALHGIRINCSDDGRSIYSRDGMFGEWTPFGSCSPGHLLRAFRLRTSHNSSKLINVQFKCSDSSLLSGIGPQVGEFTSWSRSCNQGICGLSTNVKAVQKLYISSLSNMAFYCCDS